MEQITSNNLNEQFLKAVEKNDLTTTKALVKQEKVDINYQYGEPLCRAITHNSVAVFDYLISQSKLDVNVVNPYDRRMPLHIALINNKEKMALKLLEKENIDIRFQSYTESTPLACAIFAGLNKAVDRMLLKLTAEDVDKHPEALNWSIRNADEVLVQRLLNLGFDPIATAGQQLVSISRQREHDIMAEAMDDECSFTVVFSELDKSAFQISQEYASGDIESDNSVESITAQQRAVRIKELVERHIKESLKIKTARVIDKLGATEALRLIKLSPANIAQILLQAQSQSTMSATSSATAQARVIGIFGDRQILISSAENPDLANRSKSGGSSHTLTASY